MCKFYDTELFYSSDIQNIRGDLSCFEAGTEDDIEEFYVDSLSIPVLLASSRSITSNHGKCYVEGKHGHHHHSAHWR